MDNKSLVEQYLATGKEILNMDSITYGDNSFSFMLDDKWGGSRVTVEKDGHGNLRQYRESNSPEQTDGYKDIEVYVNGRWWSLGGFAKYINYFVLGGIIIGVCYDNMCGRNDLYMFNAETGDVHLFIDFNDDQKNFFVRVEGVGLDIQFETGRVKIVDSETEEVYDDIETV